MKDTKHIRRDFNCVAWVGIWGAGGAEGVKKLFFSNMVMWHIISTGMTSRTECKLNFHPKVKVVTLGLGQKVKYHLISVNMSISKIFFYQTFVCCTNERYKTYQTGLSFCHLGHVPGVGLWGAGGAQGGPFFPNMVVWHIESTGMTSKTNCK